MNQILERIHKAKGKTEAKEVEDTAPILKDILNELKEIKNTLKESKSLTQRKAEGMMEIEDFEEIFKNKPVKRKVGRKK